MGASFGVFPVLLVNGAKLAPGIKINNFVVFHFVPFQGGRVKRPPNMSKFLDVPPQSFELFFVQTTKGGNVSPGRRAPPEPMFNIIPGRGDC